MKEIVTFDERRSCEIYISLNEDDEIIGASVYFCTPVPLYDFDFKKVGMVRGCGGCSDKGVPRNPSVSIPDPRGVKPCNA